MRKEREVYCRFKLKLDPGLFEVVLEAFELDDGGVKCVDVDDDNLPNGCDDRDDDKPFGRT